MKTFISLLSGGFDSPVASHLMMKKGFDPIFLSFITSEEVNLFKKKILKIIEILKKITENKVRIYFINHVQNLQIIKENCARKLTCILCKRIMISIAKSIGQIENTNLIVTGDILGEQASQTIDNIFAYNDLARNFIILRPLIGFDKLEIIRISEDIGLYDIISTPSGDCDFYPQFPETRAKPQEIKREENFIDRNNLISKSIERAMVLDL